MTSKENITTTIKLSLAELDTIIDSLDFKTSLNVRYESGYINRFVLLQQSLQKIRKNNNEIIRNKQNDKTKENYNQEYCETCE
tara:strand:- start:56 stop:304 length:249 start_codon:yes stop_codon:yes gene_type:complete